MIKFYAKRKIFFGISGAIMLLGIIFSFINGVHFDIQFTGGAILKYSYVGQVNIDQADNVAETALGGTRQATSQVITNRQTGMQQLVINLSGKDGLSSEDRGKIETALREAFPDAQLTEFEVSIVEPFIGGKFIRDSSWAIIIAFFLVAIYVWYSFRKISGLSAGIMAIIALIHDVLVVFITFIVFKIPINESFIAAALSIIGFSVNDTIVIYDRLRENTLLNSKGKLTSEELMDKSITQSLSRSINTNAAVFASIVIVYILTEMYGITSMRSFSLPMMVGVISGCYSTICLAGPLWVMWQNKKNKNKTVNHKSKKANA